MITKTYGNEFFGRPRELLAQMKKDGFRFTNESCPVKLTEPREINLNEDGSVTYTQWFLTDDGVKI